MVAAYTGRGGKAMADVPQHGSGDPGEPDTAPDACAPRDHGGDLAAAIARHGGAPGDWLDLSTGINPRAWPYPARLPPLPAAAWARLPEAPALEALLAAARRAYGVPPTAAIVAAPGASALIRLVPRLARRVAVAIPGPTYNEHAAAFAAEGWRVADRPGPGVTAAVIVNPNNPDGRLWARSDLLLMAEALDLLVVDESFIDPVPEFSLVPDTAREGLVVLRSFGKFFGLAGLRLGFAIGAPAAIARLGALLGPWAVSGQAIEIGRTALADSGWTAAERARLAADAERLSTLGRAAGWREVGGTALFRTFATPDARAARDRLAAARIWSRVFPYSPTWLRLGLPGEAGWVRLEAALRAAPR
jgi:cobalamin biosynthetic protein CobC